MSAVRRWATRWPQLVAAPGLLLGALVGGALGDVALGAIGGGAAGLAAAAWVAEPDRRDDGERRGWRRRRQPAVPGGGRRGRCAGSAAAADGELADVPDPREAGVVWHRLTPSEAAALRDALATALAGPT